MQNPWISEAWRGGFLLGGAWFVGWLIGRPETLLLIVMSAYLAWHLYNLYRLERWYHKRKRFHPPAARGIWGEVFHNIYQLQQRNRKRKRKLARMLTRFNEFTSAMPDAIVVLSEDDQIEWLNKAAQHHLGLHPRQDVGQRIDNLVRHPRFANFLTRGDYSKTLELPSPIGTQRILSIRIVPYGDRRRLLVVRDITRLKHLERVRQDFIANVSHELRTPLTVIAGYLENMADAGDACSQQWGKSINQMQGQSRRMIRIVEDLLTLSRLEADDTPPLHDVVAVPAILAAIREEAIALSGEAGHEITLDTDRSLWLRGGEKALYGVFSNLVFNAVQYTPPGSAIHIQWYKKGDSLYLDVRDSGIGISAQHIPRLTERFYRIDPGRSREYGGTGLGLAIVKHALERHAGRLEIESRVGEGSLFRCVFPDDLAIDRATDATE